MGTIEATWYSFGEQMPPGIPKVHRLFLVVPSMSVDTYAKCPCGSGKKIKFCKCKDSVGELDRVLKMVEGGQLVPALDRLSTILQEHPDAAWAFAIRGRLLLDLREYESLVDNAERFIRLQPSNPLALTQRAAAELFGGDTDKATESLLEALTESGRDVDAFVLDVASVLGYSLAQRGIFMTARVYSTLSMMATGYEGGQNAVQVLRQMNGSPNISQLMKSIPREISRPADVDWGERFDEAATLLHNNKIALAQSKFESLQRSVSGEASVLSGLLTCAIWRGDVDAQSTLLEKLSDCESIEEEERVRFRAMSALVVPGSPQLAVDSYDLTADIDNVEEIEMAMTAEGRFIALPPDMVAGMRTSEEDVPPRSGFQILDRDKPESLEKLPPVDEVPEAKALVFLYGKQTDREARVEVKDVRSSDLEDVRQRLGDLISGKEIQEEKGDPMPLILASQPPVATIRFHASPAEAETLQADLARSRMPAAITTMKLPILGGKSLEELKGDDSKRFDRTVVVRIVENYDAIVSKGSEIMDAVYEGAGLEPQSPIRPSAGELETLDNEDLNRVDPSDLDIESAVYLLQRSKQVSATPALRRVAKKIIGMELTDEQQNGKLLAYVMLINSADNNAEAITTLEEAKAFAEARNLPISNLLLSEVGLRLSAGDGQGFQAAIEAISSRYGNDPEVMAQLQQILMAYGLIGPDGAPRGMGGPPPGGRPGEPEQAGPPAAGGGIWTPEGGAPPSQPASEGGGKLWIPGMD